MDEIQTESEKPQTIAYLRVSTVEQDLKKNRHEILELANNKGFGPVEFVEEKVSGLKKWKERKIKQIIDQLGQGDHLIVPELSRLGRSANNLSSQPAVTRPIGLRESVLENTIKHPSSSGYRRISLRNPLTLPPCLWIGRPLPVLLRNHPSPYPPKPGVVISRTDSALRKCWFFKARSHLQTSQTLVTRPPIPRYWNP